MPGQTAQPDVHPAEIPAFPADRIREDFPILRQRVHGKPLVYLDNAATSHKPAAVINTVDRYYREYNSNVHRAIHQLAESATLAYENSRKTIANFINAPTECSIIFTRGTTEAINLVMQGWGRKYIHPGDEILVSHLEHHSNFVPWQQLALAAGAVLKVIPVDDDGNLDAEAFSRMLTDQVKLLAITHISNAIGTVNPVAGMIRAAHAVGARVLVDGAQSVPHLPVDVQDLDADFLAFSGHKMCGPTGIGVLYAKADILQAMDPFQFGGEMIDQVTIEKTTWGELPHKFEAGTPNIAGAIGLGAAINYLQDIGMEQIYTYIQELTAYAVARISAVPDLDFIGRPRERGGVVSFRLGDVHPHDMAQCLDQSGVAIRAGHVCCQPLMDRFGIPGVSRASFYFYNTREEIDALVNAIQVTRKIFGYGN